MQIHCLLTAVSGRRDARLRRIPCACVAALAAAGATAPSAALADDVPADFPRLMLDTGRFEVPPAEADLVRFQVHGEEQLRYEQLRSFPLDVTASVNKSGTRAP